MNVTKRLHFLMTLALVVGMLSSPAWAAVTVPDQQAPKLARSQTLDGAPTAPDVPIVVGEPVLPHVFEGDLRDLPPAEARIGATPQVVPLRLPRELLSGTDQGQSDRSGRAPGAAGSESPLAPAWVEAPPTGQNWEGMGNLDVALPPDTVGDVGLTYYVQMVNIDNVAIYTKTTGALASGPFNLGELWPGGDPCNTWGHGDVIVLYDHLADRWLLSQFAFEIDILGTPLPPFYECIAISRSSGDPVGGGWYAYTYQVHATKLNDYPKLGVWPDAYYMSANQFDSSAGLAWSGVGVWAFDRTAMLGGSAGSFIYVDLGADPANLIYASLLPSDLDASPPPAGTPNYFVSLNDDAWGLPADLLHVWEFHVDWAVPANSTFTGPLNLTTAPFESDLCPAYREQCIPQPDGPALEAIADRLMQRLAYRYWGDYESMVVNHTVAVQPDPLDPDPAGVRWYELRKSGAGDWSIYQQDTYVPDEHYRWMGSVAMNGAGDIGIGYSVASESLYPSIRYSGRKAGDPLNATPRRESSVIEGSGAQTHSAARWGDYSAMSVDPTDDCTFWYTQQYIETTAEASWQTRIASFKFPSCGAPHEIRGTVYDGATLRGLPWNAHRTEVTATPAPDGSGDGYFPDDAGHYRSGIVTGTYDVTARAYGYQPYTVAGVTVNGNVQVDLPLTPADFWTLAGSVSDANTGNPLRARVTVSGDPFDPPAPANQTWSDWSGTYSLSLSSQVSYTLRVEAAGYRRATRVVSPLTGDANHDFALQPDAVACTAPGYEHFGFVEDFEAGVPPPGWTETGSATGWDTNTSYGEGNYTGGMGEAVHANGADAMPDTQLRTPILDIATLPTTTLRYRANYQDIAPVSMLGFDLLDLDVSTDGGGSWTNVSSWDESHGSYYAPPGELVAVDLAPYLSGNNNVIRWRYQAPLFGLGIYAQVDEVRIAGCRVITDAAVLEPGRIEDYSCPCTPRTHKLTFVNHTGLADTVNVTYTASPSVTVLEIPDTLGLIPDNGVQPFSAVVKIDHGAPPSTTVQLTVTAYLVGSPVYSDTAVIQTLVAPPAQCPDCQCNLALDKGGPDWVYPGDAAGYAIRMVNAGELTATATILTDVIPSGATYAGNLFYSDGSGWYDGGDDAVYWSGDVGPYDTVTVTFDVVATAPVTSWVVNTATVNYCGGNLQAVQLFHVSQPPGLTWSKEVYANGNWLGEPEDGPFTVASGSTVEIVDTLTYTGTWPLFTYIFEDWSGYPLALQGESHTAGATDCGPGSCDWGVTLLPGQSRALTKSFRVTASGAITIQERLVPDETAAYTRTVVLQAVQAPIPEWEKEVWVNDVLTATYPFAGPITVWPSDTLQIVDRVNVSYTSPVTFTLVETWTSSLELSGTLFTSGAVTGGAGWLEWAATGVATDTWHALTTTFQVVSGTWAYGYLTETLWVEGAVQQADDRALTLQRGDVCLPVNVVGLDSDAPVELSDTMYFTATVLGDVPITYTWDFDDGTPLHSGAGLSTTSHHYDTAGTYTVTLEVENGCPSTDSASIRVTVNPPPVYGVEVAPAADALTGAPGSTVIYTLWVTNTGTVQDSFTLNAAGHTWTTTVPSGVGPLASGAGQGLQVTVDIPPGAGHGDQDSATITAVSQGDPAASDSSTLTTGAVAPVYGVVVAPPEDALSGAPGSTVTYTLRVTNTGNVQDSFVLTATGHTWTTTVPSGVGPLASGAGQELQVTVDIPPGAGHGDEDSATITAVSQGDPATSDSSTLTTTPAWLKLYLPLVLRDF